VTRTKFRITLAIAALMAMASGWAVAQQADIKVTNSEALKAATQTVQPEYPLIAQQLHLEGTVEIETQIGEDGSVESATPMTGSPVLADAAVAALKRWKFAPFMAGGKTVRVVAEMTFHFRL
jgi:TonB family protein